MTTRRPSASVDDYASELDVVEVFQLQGELWRTVATWEGDAKVRAVPFDAIEVDLNSLWADIRRGK